MDRLEVLPVASLREAKMKLRPVDRDSVEFLEMRDSIRDHGVLQPLLVRPIEDWYEIIAGLHRWTCACEAGLTVVPCMIHPCDDEEALLLQLVTNAVSKETKTPECAQHLKRLLARKPEMTKPELACLIRKSPSWVSHCLDLLKLRKEIQVMVDRGEIPAQNAYMLTKIPRSMQPDYVDDAKVMRCQEFRALAAACSKHFQEAVKKGKMDAFYADKFEAVAHLRDVKEIKAEIDERKAGALLCTADDCKTPLDGFYLGLRWVCHLDKASVQEQENKIRQARTKEALDVTVE